MTPNDALVVQWSSSTKDGAGSSGATFPAATGLRRRLAALLAGANRLRVAMKFIAVLLLLALVLNYGIYSQIQWVQQQHSKSKSVREELTASSSNIIHHGGGNHHPATQHPIALAVFLKRSSVGANDAYRLSIDTLRCYAAVQNYSFHLVFMEHHSEPPEEEWEREMLEKCLGDKLGDDTEHDVLGEFTYQRLCGVHEFMVAHPEHRYVAIIDADMGVINPQRRIEEFIDHSDDGESVNLIFYEREWTWEIMAGSYIARNNEKGRRFISHWHECLGSFGKAMRALNPGKPLQLMKWDADNGLLHELFLRLFTSPAEVAICHKLLLEVDMFAGPDPYFRFVACVRHFLSKNHLGIAPDASGIYYYNETVGRVKLQTKYRAWVRDGTTSVTESWSVDRDFLLHGWKKDTADVPLASRKYVPYMLNISGQYWTTPFEGEAPFAPDACAHVGSREEVIRRYWKERWRTSLMISGKELEEIFTEQSRLVQAANDVTLQKIFLQERYDANETSFSAAAPAA